PHNGGEVAGPKRHRNLIECCDFRIGGAECFGYALGCYGSRLRINRHVSRVPADNPGNIRKRYDLLGKNLVLQDEIDQDEIDDDRADDVLTGSPFWMVICQEASPVS